MNYEKVYFNLIEKRKKYSPDVNIYTEKHHIIPKSLGGENHSDNIVVLTSREHFICHALLSEMYEEGTNEWYKMNHAFMIMKANSKNHDNNNRYFGSRLYEYKKEDFSKVMSKLQGGKNNSQYGKIWIFNPHTEENKKILSEDLPIYEDCGWEKGRVIKWNEYNKKIKCKICDYEFRQEGKEKFCSNKCRNKNKKIITNPIDIKIKIKKISGNYDIKFGSIIQNKDFILECISKKCSKNQIVSFLGVNNSGANYKTMDAL